MKKLRFVAMVMISALLVCGLSTSSAFAGTYGNRTLSGIGLMYAVPGSPTIDCLAPDGSVVAQFPQQLGAFARYTLLGLTLGNIVAEDCEVNATDGSLMVTGPVIQAGDSGDELHAEYLVVFAPDFSFELQIDISGGTGRFADACGWARGGGDFDPTIGMGFTWLWGRVRIPRPHRACR